MNIKEYKKLPIWEQENLLFKEGVFIEIYKDTYNDIKNKRLKKKILLYRLFSFFIYCCKTEEGYLSIISIQGVIDYLEPKNLEEWLVYKRKNKIQLL